MYAVKEIFYTLQGEGTHAGRAAVFCRFTGCNLWSGLPETRSSALCRFCDTDFKHADAGMFASAADLAQTVASADGGSRFVVLTGGEPMLQVDAALVSELHARGYYVAAETNGTVLPPAGIDWLCVSPKAGATLRVHEGNELKVVWPQSGLDMAWLESLPFGRRYVQPLDGDAVLENTRACVEWCLAHPAWNVSLQQHKVLGIR